MKELRMILKKEFIHIIRDKITLALVLAMPIALVLLFGFTISTDIRNAKISVLDQSKDSQSKILLEKLSASGYFQIVSHPSNEAEIDNDFKEYGIKLAVIIPPNFEETLSKEHTITLQVIFFNTRFDPHITHFYCFLVFSSLGRTFFLFVFIFAIIHNLDDCTARGCLWADVAD